MQYDALNPTKNLPPVSYTDWQGAVAIGIAAGAITYVSLVYVTTPLAWQSNETGWKMLSLYYLSDVASIAGLHTHMSEVWQSWRSAMGFSAIWRELLCISSSLSVMSYSVYAFSKKIDPIHHELGRKKQTKQQARALSRIATKNEGSFLEIDGIRLTKEQIFQGIFAYGSSGSGKTVLIHEIIEKLSKKSVRFLLVDAAKGDYSLANKYADFHIVSPFVDDGAWDIARDCRSRNSAIEFAKRLIEDSSDPVWSAAARMVFVVNVCYLQDIMNLGWGWSELWNLCCEDSIAICERAAVHYPPAVNVIRDAEARSTQSIIMSFASYMSIVFELNVAWGNKKNRISFIDWLKDESDRRSFILQNSQLSESVASAYIASIIGLIARAVGDPSLPNSQNNNTLIVLDELVQLPKFDFLQKFGELGRSKTVNILAATQSPSGVISLYSKEIYDTLSTNLGCRIFCRIKGVADQQILTAQIGTRQVYIPTLSIASGGTNGGNATTGFVADKEMKLMHESELGGLQKNKYGCEAIFDDGNVLTKIVIPFPRGLLSNRVLKFNSAWDRSVYKSSQQTDAKEAVVLSANNLSHAPLLGDDVQKNAENSNRESVDAELISDFVVFDTLNTKLNVDHNLENHDKTIKNELFEEIGKELTSDILDSLTDSHISIAIEVIDLIDNSVKNEEPAENLVVSSDSSKKKRFVSKKALREMSMSK